MSSKIAVLAAAESALPASDLPRWTDAAKRLLEGAEHVAIPPSPIERVDWDVQMRKHGRRVLVSLLARGVAPERAKELAQEAWLRVIQSHRRGRLTDLRLPALVVTQAQFLAMDEQRRSEHRYAHDAVESAEGQPSLADHRLEHRVEARAQLRKIQAVVDRSHVNAQRVFGLLYGGQGLSAPEIASRLGLSVQRVRQIICELRARIRREVDGGIGHG